MSIQSHSDVRGFFHERLNAALLRIGVRPSDSTAMYLLELLVSGSRSSLATSDQPLVQRLAAALEAETNAERLRGLRDTGDAALYTAGFFGEHVEGRGMSHSYYQHVGGRAYDAASRLTQRRRATFAELAEHFGRFVQVLDEVREETALRTPQDIVRLYDRWRRTGDARLARRLRAQGVFPQHVDKDLLH